MPRVTTRAMKSLEVPSSCEITPKAPAGEEGEGVG